MSVSRLGGSRPPNDLPQTQDADGAWVTAWPSRPPVDELPAELSVDDLNRAGAVEALRPVVNDAPPDPSEVLNLPE